MKLMLKYTFDKELNPCLTIGTANTIVNLFEKLEMEKTFHDILSLPMQGYFLEYAAKCFVQS